MTATVLSLYRRFGAHLGFAILIGYLFLCAQAFYAARRSHAFLKHQNQRNNPAARLATPTSVEFSVLQRHMIESAKASGVPRLTRVSNQTSNDKTSCRLEWEASLESSLNFMNYLSQKMPSLSCSRIEMCAGTVNNVKISAVYGIEARALLPAGPPTHVSALPTIRQTLFSIPATTYAKNVSALAITMSPRRLSQSQRTTQIEEEKRAQEAAVALETKRRELETDLIVTGIVNNGRESLAFIQTRSASLQTLMVRQGDMLHEARVTSINEKSGDVFLDYAGKIQVQLRLAARLGNSL